MITLIRETERARYEAEWVSWFKAFNLNHDTVKFLLGITDVECKSLMAGQLGNFNTARLSRYMGILKANAQKSSLRGMGY